MDGVGKFGPNASDAQMCSSSRTSRKLSSFFIGVFLSVSGLVALISVSQFFCARSAVNVTDKHLDVRHQTVKSYRIFLTCSHHVKHILQTTGKRAHDHFNRGGREPTCDQYSQFYIMYSITWLLQGSDARTLTQRSANSLAKIKSKHTAK